MLAKGLKKTSINKIIKSISAIIKNIILELELDAKNPFIGLTFPQEDTKRDLRAPFSELELHCYLTEAKEHINEEAYYCTVLQAYTGARTEEITGLEINDVKTNVEIPHLIIRKNSIRPNLKTGIKSERLVPLIGEALELVIIAIEYAKKINEIALFPRYAKRRGSDSLSAVQMKLIRSRVSKNPKLTAYSTRHRMKDLLRNAGVEEKIQLEILGHSSSQAPDSYGSGYWLPVLKEAMQKALDFAKVKMKEEMRGNNNELF